MKGFRGNRYISSFLPKLFLAQCGILTRCFTMHGCSLNLPKGFVDKSGELRTRLAGKGTATHARRKDVSGARVRMPLKNQKEKIRASPWKICFDFFLLIGSGVACAQRARRGGAGLVGAVAAK
jgi:hypothetical protein